ncbi:MAG: outer membrane beta-barrel protein [Devosia sp.]
MDFRTFAVVTVLASFPATAAFAQDAGDVDWSGFYVGGNAGYSVTDGNAVFINSPLTTIAIPSGQQGLLGGIQAGANFQAGSIVLGIEGNATVSTISSTYADPLIGMGAPIGSTVTSGSDYQGALLVRGGLGIGNFLPYVTAGAAFAHVYSTATAGGADDDGLFTGYAYGAGVEVAFDDNWSLNARYLHTELTGPNFNAGLPYETSAAPSSNTLTVGMNVRF